MKNTLEFKKFTDLEKQVIRAWCNQINFLPENFEEDMHSAISYWVIKAKEISRVTHMPPKKLRGVMSSLVKKVVFYEDEIEGDTWMSPNQKAFYAGGYFWADNADGDQATDCNMAKVYDAIK